MQSEVGLPDIGPKAHRKALPEAPMLHGAGGETCTVITDGTTVEDLIMMPGQDKNICRWAAVDPGQNWPSRSNKDIQLESEKCPSSKASHNTPPLRDGACCMA